MEISLIAGQAPTPLVLEQDFILQLRRLQRLGTPVAIANIRINQAPLAQQPGQLEALQDKLQGFAIGKGGSTHLMSNGDAFVVLPRTTSADPAQLVNELMHAVFVSEEVAGRSLHTLYQLFMMPENYTDLRHKIEDYMQAARLMEEKDELSPEMMLQREEVKGPLTAYSLAQVERLLESLDLPKYIKKQRVYEVEGDGSWVPFYDEYHVGIKELAEEKFPKLDIGHQTRLFLEFCSMLDRRVLNNMLTNVDNWQNTRISLNLSAATVLSSTFAQFCHVVHGARRSLVCFELNCRDVLQDFDLTKSAIETMRQEGFRIALDAVTPELLPYFRFNKFNPDYIKVMASRQRLHELQQEDVMRAVRSLPRGQLIFYHCENRTAIDAGLALGVNKFQGFYVDQHVGART